MRMIARRKPVQYRAVAKVATILEAAVRVLQESGLAGYNTNTIAARAGVSIGSLYQYFPSKDAITAALVVQWYEQKVADMAQLVEATADTSADEAIVALVNMVISVRANSKTVSRILEGEAPRFNLEAVADAEYEIKRLNRIFFSRHVDPEHCTEGQLDNAARDTLIFIRSMLSAAEDDHALDHPDLPARLTRMTKGYLAPLLHP